MHGNQYETKKSFGHSDRQASTAFQVNGTITAIKHNVKRQTANTSLHFTLLSFYRILKYISKIKGKKITHSRQTQIYSFRRTNAKGQTAQKWNVMLNLSNKCYNQLRVVLF